MHFWIDKRSQACGYNGRHRVPASLSSGHRRRSKPMVTPIHRFQTIESGLHNQRLHGRPAPPPQPPSSNSARYRTVCFTPPSSVSGSVISRTSHTAELDSGVFLDETNLEQRHEQSCHYKSKLKCVICTTGALFSLLPFYIYVAYKEVIMISTLSSIIFILLCTFYFWKSKRTPPVENPVVTGITEVVPTSSHENDSQTMPTPTLSHNSATQPTTNRTPTPEASPPPYHIAILLPPKELFDESPPPNYEKAVS